MKIRILALHLALLLCTVTASAQNLVPNGSFEEYVQCPVGAAQWFQVEHWNSPYNQSADYFNECNANGLYGVPANLLGYQAAAEGEGYMGLCVYRNGDSLYREIIVAELLQPLEVGVPVCTSFKVALGGFGSFAPNSPIYTCKGIGLQFFRNLPLDWSSYLYPNSSALYVDALPTDTAVWYSISGSYVPDSAYTHLAVSNFFDDGHSEVELLDTSGYGSWPYAYVFVDDVKVILDTGDCGQYQGKGYEESGSEWLVYPNPCTTELRVVLPLSWDVRSRLELCNSLGQIVGVSTSVGQERLIMLPVDLPAAPYLLRAISWQGQSLVISVVHVSP